MNTNLLLKAGRLENESNQKVILAVNSGLRNRWVRWVRWVRCQGGPEEDPKPDPRNPDCQAAWAEFGKQRDEARVAFFPLNSHSL
jgi:hypothetical protein